MNEIVSYQPAKLPAAAAQQYQEAARRFLEHSQADNTKQAYETDWSHFLAFVQEMNLPMTGDLLKVAETVVIYITHLAESDYKVSTIERRLVAISRRYEAEGLDSPSKTLMVRQVMKGIRRELGTARQGKAPMLTKHIQRWIKTLGNDIISTRNKALILVGFAGAFRRSELVALDVQDLAFSDKGVIVTIRRSKTDQEGKGQPVGIVYGSDPTTCPVLALEAWLQAGEIRQGPVFRRIRGDRAGGKKITPDRLSDRSVADIVKDLAETVELDPALFSGHSLRSGHITQTDATEDWSMRQSRHKSLIVHRGYKRPSDLLCKKNSSGQLGL